MASRSPATTDPPTIVGHQAGALKPLDPNPIQLSVKNIVDVLSEVSCDNLLPLAIQLGLEKHYSDILFEAGANSDLLRERLATKWLQKHEHVASWGVLVSALQSKSVQEMVVAETLKARFLRRESGTSTFSSSGSEPYSPRSPNSNVSDTTEEKGTEYK